MWLVKNSTLCCGVVICIFYIHYKMFWKVRYQDRSWWINVKGDEDMDKKTINETINFLETSGKNYLSLRQVAAVESVARFVHHRRILVWIFSKDNITFTPAMEQVSIMLNVQFIKAEMLPIFKNTPLEQWYTSGLVQTSEYVVAHTSDALRLALLWKYGGIYMDLDIIMFRKYRVTRPSVYWEANMIYLGNNMLAFHKGHSLIEMYMDDFARNYSPSSYAGNGPWMFTRVFKNYKKSFEEEGRDCDVDEVHPYFFSSLNFNETTIYFDETGSKRALLSRTQDTFGHHIWNFNTKNLKISPKSQCAYMQFLKMNSPIVYLEMLNSEYV